MVSPFYFFGTMRLFQNSHFSFFFQKYFQKNFRIFLMSPKGLLQFFWYFATNWIFKKPKWSPLSTFSALWDCFKILIFRFFSKIFSKKFSNFFNVSKGSPSIFLIFCNKLNFQKAQMVSPFYFFGTMRLFQNSHFSFFFQKYFQKNFRIFLMSPKGLLQFFWYFATNWIFKKPKWSPLSTFSALWDCFKVLIFRFFSKIFSKKFSNFFNVSKGSPSIFLIFCNKLNFQKAQMVSPFYFFGTMRLFQNSHFSFFFQKYFQKNFRIFLMSPKGLLQFFWYFATNWIFKKPKWSPLSTFSALWDCFKILIFRFFFKNIFKKIFEFF